MKTSERYQELRERVDMAHDWANGFVRGGSGTAITYTDSCRICGLTGRCFNDSQNGVEDALTFENHDGIELTLRDAAELEC